MRVPESRRPPAHVLAAAADFLASARFGQVLTLAIVGTGYLSFAARSTIGWPGLIGAVTLLVVLAATSLFLRRAQLEWRGLLPLSLLVFMGWSALSVVWSEYQWVTLASVLYQVSFAFLGAYVALTRDLIQIVRAFGDVLRMVLIGSFIAEILSGIVLDLPFTFLGITGDLYRAGPIQGLLGTRNSFGLVALVALVTFFIELQTRSVPRPRAYGSITLGALALVFSRSPVAAGVLLIVAVAAAAVLSLRRLPPPTRRVGQYVLLAAVVIGGVIMFVARGRVIALLNAGSEFEFRYTLWHDVLALTNVNTIEGFGWIGYWRQTLVPYVGIDLFGVPHASALNAYLDVWLQLGIVGLLSFLAFVGLAFGRSWLLASNKRSIVFLWPALVLIVLIVVSAAESLALVEFSWLTLVICTLKASQNLSWRARLSE